MTSSFHSNFSDASDAHRYLEANERYEEKLSPEEVQKHLNKIKTYRSKDGETLLNIFLKNHLFIFESKFLIKIWPESLFIENLEGKTTLSQIFKEASQDWDEWMVEKRIKTAHFILENYLQDEFNSYIPPDIYFKSCPNASIQLIHVWQEDLSRIKSPVWLGMYGGRIPNCDQKFNILCDNVQNIETYIRLKRQQVVHVIPNPMKNRL